MVIKTRKERKKFRLKTLKIITFILLAYAAIWVGIIGGNALFQYDTALIQSVDTETLKFTFKNSLPIIDTIYNSGNISISFSNEIKNIVGFIFDFDLSRPTTVFNAQSSYFYSYYNKDYLKLVAQQESSNQNNEIPNSDSSQKTDETSALKEDASSIRSEDNEVRKEPTDTGVVSNGKITINNETKYKINIDELLKEPLKLNFDRKGPKVLIYHTHTTESYLRNISQLNVSDVPGWTEDPRYNVVRVGEELAQNLRKNGIEVIHNATRHDYPNSNGAYGRSLDTITKILKSYPSIKVALDIHRDGLGDNEKLRAVTSVNNKNTAQVMFVVGTDQIGLSHPNWRENLKFALKLQEKLNDLAPKIAKPIDISTNRYNQQVTMGTLIIEIGGDGNTLDEALESTKYLAKVISSVIK